MGEEFSRLKDKTHFGTHPQNGLTPVSRSFLKRVKSFTTTPADTVTPVLLYTCPDDCVAYLPRVVWSGTQNNYAAGFSVVYLVPSGEVLNQATHEVERANSVYFSQYLLRPGDKIYVKFFSVQLSVTVAYEMDPSAVELFDLINIPSLPSGDSLIYKFPIGHWWAPNQANIKFMNPTAGVLTVQLKAKLAGGSAALNKWSASPASINAGEYTQVATPQYPIGEGDEFWVTTSGSGLRIYHLLPIFPVGIV